MLVFDFRHRISVEECLEHPYFAPIRKLEDEIVSSSVFNVDFEQMPLTTPIIKGLSKQIHTFTHTVPRKDHSFYRLCLQFELS